MEEKIKLEDIRFWNLDWHKYAIKRFGWIEYLFLRVLIKGIRTMLSIPFILITGLFCMLGWVAYNIGTAVYGDYDWAPIEEFIP